MEQMSKQKVPEGNFVVIFDNVAAACQKLFECSRNTECIRGFGLNSNKSNKSSEIIFFVPTILGYFNII